MREDAHFDDRPRRHGQGTERGGASLGEIEMNRRRQHRGRETRIRAAFIVIRVSAIGIRDDDSIDGEVECADPLAHGGTEVRSIASTSEPAGPGGSSQEQRGAATANSTIGNARR